MNQLKQKSSICERRHENVFAANNLYSINKIVSNILQTVKTNHYLLNCSLI